jgi:4-aminobutyrate aminotransferase/(S)-3-amino-2-methylpropionate transaminase
MDRWPESTGEAIHTSTFLGHPLGCAAALAVLDHYEEHDVHARVRAAGQEWTARLRERLADIRRVREIRGLGLLLGIELGDGDGRPGGVGAGGRVAEALLEVGVLVLPAGAGGNVVEVTPSVYLTEAQLSHAVEALAVAIEALDR